MPTAGASGQAAAIKDVHNNGKKSEENNTEFFGSQIGSQSVINYSYTDSPWRLLLYDFKYFFVFWYALPWIVWPVKPCDSGSFDELAFTRPNMFCLFMHGILIIYQLAFFLLILPAMFFLPVWIVIIGLVAFFLVNWALVYILNGTKSIYESDPKYAVKTEANMREKWVFINGVAVGEAWMMSNINRLALTFKRPITGIHNKTTGIIFDVFECLIQRNFSYATPDVRDAYKVVKQHLYDPSISKIVLIAHSQGGIEASLVIDWLLQELPQDLMSKLECYTFGNAANHFNSPMKHVPGSESSFSSLHGKKKDTSDHAAEEHTYIPVADSPVEMRTDTVQSMTRNEKRPGSSSEQDKGSPKKRSKANGPERTSTNLSSQKTHSISVSNRKIAHIEHYAHTTDFVALWGVLHFATNRGASPLIPRFIGQVFSRTSTRGGHQFCQHYLDGMFPLSKNKSGEFTSCADTNDFMESIVVRGKEGCEYQDKREAELNSWEMMELHGYEREGEYAVAVVHGSFHEADRVGRARAGKIGDGNIRVKDLSRLWLYRNGRSPQDLPVGLLRDGGGVIRAGTL